MAGKSNTDRVGNLEKEMEEVKIKLERLPEMEKMMDTLTHGLARMLLALEETNRAVQSIGKFKGGTKTTPEQDNSDAVPREKSLEEGGKGRQGKLSDEPIIIFQSTQSKGTTEMLRPDEPFIELPYYPDFRPEAKLLKLKGRIKHREVVVLIKSDTTHNFVSEKLVVELRLPLSATRDYVVLMDDYGAEGDCVSGYVILELPGMKMVEQFLPLYLVDNVDIILGNRWLNNLENAMIYYEDGLCRMKFVSGKNMIDWEADPSL